MRQEISDFRRRIYTEGEIFYMIAGGVILFLVIFLDLLFVTILAFARSGAADSRGGSSRRTLVNTLNQ